MQFSTVIPLYNKQKSVRRAIYSALDQQCALSGQHELIIVDDGSTDNSVAEVRRIQKEQSEKNIILHTQTNAGVSAARNKGVELASNEYITFLDADDTYEVNFYQELTELANKFPDACALGTAYRHINTNNGTKRNANIVGLSDQQQQILDNYFYSAAFGDLPVISSSICIKKSSLLAIGGFPENENMGEDQAVWSQLALNGEIAISQAVCANYFVDIGGSLMQTVAPSNEMPFSQRLQSQLKQDQIPSRLRTSVKEYIAGHLLDLVRRNKQSGNVTTANELLNDKRSQQQFKRWVYWKLRVTTSDLMTKLQIFSPA